MDKINFSNLPSTTTPVNATNLNLLQTNTENAIASSQDADYVTTSANLNDYKNSGSYYFSQTPTNVPTGSSNGWLHVLAIGTQANHSCKQVWYRRGTNNENDFMTYVRTYDANGGTWSTWHKLADVITGTWTPTMQNATVSYTTRSGTYVKNGPMLYFECQLRGTISAVGDPAYSYISGLPYKPRYPRRWWYC